MALCSDRSFFIISKKKNLLPLIIMIQKKSCRDSIKKISYGFLTYNFSIFITTMVKAFAGDLAMILWPAAGTSMYGAFPPSRWIGPTQMWVFFLVFLILVFCCNIMGCRKKINKIEYTLLRWWYYHGVFWPNYNL